MAADLVTTGDIANGAVTRPKLATDSVVSAKILNDSIFGGDIKNGSVTGADIDLFNDDRCTGETVQGTAAINTYPIVPDTFTTNGVDWGHSCSGEPVKVRRLEAGVYEVSFGAGSPSRLAVVAPKYGGFSVGAENLGNGLFKVLVLYTAGAGQYSDSDFSILAY